MVRKYLLPLLAGLLFLFAVYHVVGSQQTGPKVEPPVTPARSPFANTVAGAGLVEAESENISVGSHVPGVVVEVPV